jgi:integrase
MPPEQRDWLDTLSGSRADSVRAAVRRLDNAHENGEITDRDHERIHELLRWEAEVAPGKDGTPGKSNNTLKNHAQNLYKTAQRSDTPLVEHDAASVEELVGTFASGSHDNVKDGGLNDVSNYQKALRVFYDYHDDLGVNKEKIDIQKSGGKDLQPRDLLYRDEVDQILQQNRDLKDRAMFALMLATGQRNDAVRTLRVKHVAADGRTMEVRLNETEGALKGASGTVPLLWAKHYVRQWYEHHPFRDDPEAALFPPSKGSVAEEDRRDVRNEDSTTKAIRRMADRAGVEKDRYGITPHILRASAITRMAARGVSEQRIKQIAGWSRDSSQFGTYVALADNINNDRAREELGYATSDTEMAVIGRPTLETCPECTDPIPEGRDVCPTCGFDLSAPADEPEPAPDADGVAGGLDGLTIDRIADAMAHGMAESSRKIAAMPDEQREAIANADETGASLEQVLRPIAEEKLADAFDNTDSDD